MPTKGEVARRKQRADTQKKFKEWKHPVGIRVRVVKDDKSVVETTTRSDPWQLGDGTPVIMLEGISGGYLLSRVEPVSA